MIDLVIPAKPRDLGGFEVRRVLPAMQRRLVGPFIFWDHMGPTDLAPGHGFDVRPHPHIGLATVTYLFEGAIVHKDSLGSDTEILPGDVNWMIAGRGIAHSERSSEKVRRDGIRMHGIQSWVALPIGEEEHEPSFTHYAKADLPHVELPGVSLDVIAGTAYGKTSPVVVLSPTIYVHALLQANANLPIDDTHEERAIYVVSGEIRGENSSFGEGTLLVLTPRAHVAITALADSRIMLLGGARIEGHREIWWNFVSSSKERIERAKADWKSQNWPKVPGDDQEFIPLPER